LALTIAPNLSSSWDVSLVCSASFVIGVISPVMLLQISHRASVPAVSDLFTAMAARQRGTTSLIRLSCHRFANSVPFVPESARRAILN
jgi:hypothetical protein